MTIDTIDVVIYTFQFIVPGYIIRETISSISPQKNCSDGEKTVQAIGYSILNIALWYWLYWIIQHNVSRDSAWYRLLSTLAILLTGGITGVALGVIRAKNIFRKIFSFFKINYHQPVPTAWDYKFSAGDKQWIEVMVNDGKVIRGLYSSKSFSASDSEYRDIYLEELYTKNQNGWKKWRWKLAEIR